MEVCETTLEHRLVHLDLKGAPPKLSYYEWLFPLLSKWGATGLLVEYEDMFPYSGQLLELAAPNAYSQDQVKQLLALAKQCNLEVIPLVQTFGHFEFVLKHDKFRHLREVEHCPMSVCPSHEGSIAIIQEMIGQVLKLHPDITAFHIGADEVYHIGLCGKCIERMNRNIIPEDGSNSSGCINGPMELFLNHITRVLKYLKQEYNHLRLIMWDDMFRSIELSMLQESGIGKLVEPMVWYYQRQIKLSLEMWTRYSKVFPGLWVASAYKGATGPCMVATDIGYHVENHKEWISLVESCVKPLMSKFYGYALTGWQRYDHYAVLCELLPVGLPSLAICLLTTTTGAFTIDVHQMATQDLGFSQLIPMNPFASLAEETVCEHLGSDIFRAVHALIQLRIECKFFFKSDRLKGWMTEWHVQNNYSNPAHVSHFLPHGQQLMANLEQLSDRLSAALSEVFYADTVDEWMSVNVKPTLTKLSNILSSASKQIAIGGGPKKPSRLDSS